MNRKARLLAVLAAGSAIAMTASYLYGAGTSSTGHAQPGGPVVVAQAPIPQQSGGADVPARLNLRSDSPTGTPGALPPPATATNPPPGAATTAAGAAGTAAATTPANRPGNTPARSVPKEAPAAPSLSTTPPALPTATNGGTAAGSSGAAQSGAIQSPPPKPAAAASSSTSSPPPAQPAGPQPTQLGTSGSMTIVPTPAPGTLSEIAKIQGEITLAKAKADLKQVEVTIADLEKKLNPPNPIADLIAAGVLPPGLVPNSRVPTGPAAPGAPVAAAPFLSPSALPAAQALQAILPLAERSEQPPKLLMIRGKDVVLEAIFEAAEDVAPSPLPGQARDKAPAAGRQITVQQGDELPGKWVVQLITHSSVSVGQQGKSERLMLRPGDYLPVRYSEPAPARGKAQAKPTPLSSKPDAAKADAAKAHAAKPGTAASPAKKPDAASSGKPKQGTAGDVSKRPAAKGTPKSTSSDTDNNG